MALTIFQSAFDTTDLDNLLTGTATETITLRSDIAVLGQITKGH